ncbi:MAG: sulfite exporter TauE/SafE family protein [Chthoniobacterales bacterium]
MTTLHFSTSGWIMLVAGAFCCGLSKGGFGGFGLITVLLMAMVLPPKESTGTVLPLLIAADLMAIGGFRRHVDWREFRGLLPSTFFGLLAGWFLMTRIPDSRFGPVLGWVILAMMALVVWQRLDRRVIKAVMHHPLLSTFSGFAAGVSTMMANAGGPAMTFHLLTKRFDKMAFVGTSAWFFFVINLTKVPLSLNLGLISRSSILLNLMLLPSIVLGFITGKTLLGKVSQKPFEWLVVLMSIASAIKLILS